MNAQTEKQRRIDRATAVKLEQIVNNTKAYKLLYAIRHFNHIVTQRWIETAGLSNAAAEMEQEQFIKRQNNRFKLLF